jgi:hypothetical protein
MRRRNAMGKLQHSCSDNEIDAFAGALISELGIRATNYVAATMALMKDRGDVEAERLWRRIYGAVGRLNPRADGPAARSQAYRRNSAASAARPAL